jgi:hypothetical protein
MIAVTQKSRRSAARDNHLTRFHFRDYAKEQVQVTVSVAHFGCWSSCRHRSVLLGVAPYR